MWALILATGIINAQEVIIEGVSSKNFSGVQTLNGDYYYTFYFGEKSATKGMINFVLSIYDKELKSINTTPVEISKNAELAASAFNGKFFLFVFSDAIKRKRTLLVLDQKGNIVKQRVDEDVKSSLLMPENNPHVHGISTEEFLIVRPEKEKKFGYEVERIDTGLVSKWTKSFFPEKGFWTIEDTKLVNGKLYILRDEKAALLSDKHTYAVQQMKVENGEVSYTTSLDNGDDGGFPNFIQVSENGVVATGGMYFKNGKYDDKNSDGLFFALLAADGSITKYSKTSWGKVKDQLKGDFSSDLFGGKTKVLVEDIVKKTDGNYMIIGETWRKSNDANNTGAGALTSMAFGKSGGSDGKERGFTVMDFCIFNFDAQGELMNINRIEKATKEAVIKGELANSNGLAMAQELYKRKFFCYRKTIDIRGEQYLMYKNEDGFKTKAYFLPVDATTTENAGFLDMDKWVSEDLNKVGKLSKMMGSNKSVFGNEGTFGVSNPELYKNIIYAKPGFVLLYHLKGDQLAMWLQKTPK